ncbi:MAG: succinate dehydrogenase, cytochrome b556 subunit [Gammaproteobacteria bacterium]|jgi:succinate dehydrogenase / fumarate reductase cytochrome b subunit
MATANRPLSPHLQIYKPQITSVLSILHRLTGVFLSLGSILLVAWLVSVDAGPDAFASVSAFVSSWFGLILLAGWTWALFYHLCNGIRHLFWDAGLGFEITTAYASGWAVVVISLLASVIVWVVGFGMLGGAA